MLHLPFDPTQSIKDLTQFLLCGSNSLSEAERALIATVVSNNNECWYCTNAQAPVSEKMKALLTIAFAVREGGERVMPELMHQAILAGATDVEIHDTVLLAVLFVEPVAGSPQQYFCSVKG